MSIVDFFGPGKVMEMGSKWADSRGAIDDTLEKQTDAVKEATGYPEDLFGKLEDLYEPLIKMGDEQLAALREGVESGMFEADDTIMRDYEAYVAPEYRPGGRFEYQDRNRLERPERFDYNRREPQLNMPQPWKDPGQFQTPQAPNPIEVSNKFDTPLYRQPTDRPDIYRAPDAPAAEYYDPTQRRYEDREFRLEDDPVYQRRLEQSGKAIESSAAARGMQLSGATLKALQENAQDIAAEEGDAAWRRFREEDDTRYNRFMDQENRVQDATRYRTEDEYRRYLDSIGIRTGEQDRLVDQWYQDRSFGAQQSDIAFERENIEKNLGRAITDDEFNRYMAQRGQGFTEFANQRDFGRNVYQQDVDNTLDIYGAQTGQYNQGFQNALAANAQNWGQNMDYQNIYNNLFTTDRAFDYGVSQDTESDRWNQYMYNNQLRGGEAATNYGVLSDLYNRNTAANQSKYGMIGDLANLGIGARDAMGGAMSDLYGSRSDMAIQQANAQAAADATKYANRPWWVKLTGG